MIIERVVGMCLRPAHGSPVRFMPVPHGIVYAPRLRSHASPKKLLRIEISPSPRRGGGVNEWDAENI